VMLPDRRRRARWLEGGAADHDPGLPQRRGVGAVGAPVGVLALGVGARGQLGRRLVDQNRVLHGAFLLDPMTGDRARFRPAGCESISLWLLRTRSTSCARSTCRRSPTRSTIRVARSRQATTARAPSTKPRWTRRASGVARA